MSTYIIEARDVLKQFSVPKGEPVTALDHIGMLVPRGQLTALVGPDGAGKTNFMRLLTGLMVVDSGELKVAGCIVRDDPQAVQNLLSYMPQKFGLYEGLTVQENMDLYANLHGVPQDVRKERFARLLDMTGLSAFTARLAGKLSGGMKQKLGLACTLVRSPELLLLDEPTVGVDPLSRRDLWDMLQSRLLDDEHVTDAVPAGGRVHFITKETNGCVPFLQDGTYDVQPAQERLEDAFMILLKEDEEKNGSTLPAAATALPDNSKAFQTG